MEVTIFIAERIFGNSMRPFLNQKRCDQGFSLIEVVVVTAVLGIIACVSVALVSDIAASAESQKLEGDVKVLNSAVGAYLAFGGKLDGKESSVQVIAKLKSRATSGSAEQVIGLRGYFLDPRIDPVMQTAEEAADTRERVYWNGTLGKFEVGSSGPPGIKEFRLNEDFDESDFQTETRDTVMDYAHDSTWIWDYQDHQKATPTGPTVVALVDVPESTVPAAAATPPIPSTPLPPAGDLQPPGFSIATGNYPIAGFNLALTLSNPNPGGSSEIFYSIDYGNWETYTGSPIDVTPEAIVKAQALPLDPAAWNSSSVVEEIYGVIPELLLRPAILTGPTPNGVVPSGTTVALSNPNDPAVSSLVYQLDSGGWQSYSAPFIVPSSPNITLVEAKAVATAQYYLDSDVRSHSIPGAVVSNTLVVDADTDTSIGKNAPNWAGYYGQVYSTADNSTPSLALLYFNLADDISGPGTVDSAVLYLTSTDPHGTNGPFALHEVKPSVNWRNGGLTWNTAGDGLAKDGTELKADSEDTSTVVSVIPGVPGWSDRKKWDITALAQQWVDEPASNNGFAIIAVAPNRDIFCSSEHLGASTRPKLVITWTPDPGND